VLLNASASGISCTPAVGSALLAHSGSGLADTVYHHPARATAHTGLRDHGIGLMNRRERHCLYSGSQSQPEHKNSYCSDHCFLLISVIAFFYYHGDPDRNFDQNQNTLEPCLLNYKYWPMFEGELA
jgi:hypothetical protein